MKVTVEYYNGEIDEHYYDSCGIRTVEELIMERGHMTIEHDDNGSYLLAMQDEYGDDDKALLDRLSRGDMIRIRNAINKILDD